MSEQLVYDPTKDRQGPRNKAKVLEKLDNGKLKDKYHKSTTASKQETKPKVEEKKHEKKAAEQPKAEQKGKIAKFSDEQFVEALKAIGHAATSREVSDKLGIKDPDLGRQMVRQRMAKLIQDGKVKSVEPKEGRAKQLYALP
jgi:hypothetical protein